MAVGKKAFEKRNKDNTIAGINIFNDDRGRYVYRDPISRTGYVIEGRIKEFRTFSSRFILGIIAGLLCLLFSLPWYVCLIAGIITFVLVEFKFRSFLKRLPQIHNFKPAEKTNRIDAEAANERFTIILKLVLLLLVAVLIIVNAHIRKYESFMLIFNYIISAGALYLAFMELKALLINMKNNKK